MAIYMFSTASPRYYNEKLLNIHQLCNRQLEKQSGGTIIYLATVIKANHGRRYLTHDTLHAR